ncbi:DUF839 domain-containing protein [bacterium]|nr:DUF839 domain-containing protein [bacterium]
MNLAPRRPLHAAFGLAMMLTVAFAATAFAQTLELDLPGSGTGSAAYLTDQPAQMTTRTDATLQNWRVRPLLTIGETMFGYRPVGILDGTGAKQIDAATVRLWVNHELSDDLGYPYTLANGTSLVGARVSWFDVDRQTRSLLGGGLAYDTVYDRYGNEVTSAMQINEGSSETDGFDRFCSANFYAAGEYSLEDDIFFTGEETGGGQECALDVENGLLWVAPALGRAAWESVCLLETGDPNTVAVLVGDDRQGAPLLLYVGQKNAMGDGSFLDRNGLAMGTLYVWVSDDGFSSPEDWNGTRGTSSGTFVALDYYQPDMAGMNGWDDAGWADQDTQDAMSAAAGAFEFSRPEDVATDPDDPTRAVMASTGRPNAYPSDSWGTTYLIDVEFGEIITADLEIIYDGDDAGDGQFEGPDYGLRSPDNLDWADDGYIYLQEDRSIGDFGQTSGMEASLWALDPVTGELTRVAMVDRSAVPEDQFDSDPDDIGDWETSGVLDVTDLFPTRSGETLLLADVQAHSLRGEGLGGENQASDLVQGGQLLFLSGTVDADGLAPKAPVIHTGATLLGNAPNPFNPMTRIGFRLDQSGPVRMRVFDAAGRLVRTLVDGQRTAGEHTVTWDGRNDQGGRVASGVYSYRLETREGQLSRQMLLVK